MYGIEKLKEATLIAVSIGKGFESRLEDGHISWTEWISFIPTLWSVKTIIMDANDIWLEILDLDDNERRELNEYVAEVLELDSERVERIIEKAFAWILTTADLVLEFTTNTNEE